MYLLEIKITNFKMSEIKFCFFFLNDKIVLLAVQLDSLSCPTGFLEVHSSRAIDFKKF